MYVSGWVHVDGLFEDRRQVDGEPDNARGMSERRDESGRVADLLDLHEGRLGRPLLDDGGIRDVLTSARRIAIIGASADPGRPSHGVLRQLRAVGYDVVPVNPNQARVDGLACYPGLAEAVAATGPVDIVDVFRRSDQCVTHAREAVAVGAACLWLQLGVASREAGRIAVEGGLRVVMDRCTIIEYRRIHAGEQDRPS
jgi:predicted CoA-binding protein